MNQLFVNCTFHFLQIVAAMESRPSVRTLVIYFDFLKIITEKFAYGLRLRLAIKHHLLQGGIVKENVRNTAKT